jgi:hypothetical protein
MSDWKAELDAYIMKHARGLNPSRPDNTPEQIAELGVVTSEEVLLFMREMEAYMNEYDPHNPPCDYCGEGCDPMAATPIQWQCSSCEQWNDKT